MTGREKPSVLILGSGPIRIGQAAEFDYSGSQACRALKERGFRVILLNSNPATIQTDRELADLVYLRPLEAEVVESLLELHRPEGILASLGGQTALNLLMELEERGSLERFGVRVWGTQPGAVRTAEAREPFRDLMAAIGQPVIPSRSVGSVEEALAAADELGLPLVLRPDFTLGGTGGGVCTDGSEYPEQAAAALAASPVRRVLVERFLEGWREVELEMLRDGEGNALCVCGMENLDPMGVHTGDSVVVAPVLTLKDRTWQRLRTAALRIVEALDIRGACNVQFALRPDEEAYGVIEVNPRASRSSALASKATGYPIARMAALIGAGLSLAELPNPVTGSGSALIEPALDYLAVKVPCFPFEKFPGADPSLGTRMKATGEVLALGTDLAGALLKAYRGLGSRVTEPGFWGETDRGALEEALTVPTDRRIGALFEWGRRGLDPEEAARISGIHPFFCRELAELGALERALGEGDLTPERLREAKARGLGDRRIGQIRGLSEREVRRLRREHRVEPGFREVDGCAGETPAGSRYLYGVYRGASDPMSRDDRPAVVVLGSGPIRIGQGLEFDYCCVKAVEALRRRGYRGVLVNDNPETVSTDHDVSDALYLAPLATEDVLEVCRREKVAGAFVTFGGQTALRLAQGIQEEGVSLLGTSFEAIQAAEDRDLFSRILSDLGLSQPPGRGVRNLEEGIAAAEALGFPLMVRPSFVLGGLAMRRVRDREGFEAVLEEAFRAAPGQSVLVDRFLEGREFEVDALCDGSEVLIPGIFEHLDPAGIHSGDSMALFPQLSLRPEETRFVEQAVRSLSEALGLAGLLNVQFVHSRGRLWILEANPRGSRTVPIVSKLTGLPLVDWAVGLGLGEHLGDLTDLRGLLEPTGPLGVKIPVFSGEKLPGAETLLGPLMQSTGESLGVGDSLAEAFREAAGGAGWRLPSRGTLLVAGCPSEAAGELAAHLASLRARGFGVWAEAGCAPLLERWGFRADRRLGEPEGREALRDREADLLVVLEEDEVRAEGWHRGAVDGGIPRIANLPALRAWVLSLPGGTR